MRKDAVGGFTEKTVEGIRVMKLCPRHKRRLVSHYPGLDFEQAELVSEGACEACLEDARQRDEAHLRKQLAQIRRKFEQEGRKR